jgi:hypothetical protein
MGRRSTGGGVYSQEWEIQWSEGSLGEILCGNLWWQTQEVSRDWPTYKNRTGSGDERSESLIPQNISGKGTILAL